MMNGVDSEWEVEYFELDDPSKTKPVEEFLDKQHKRVRALLQRILDGYVIPYGPVQPRGDIIHHVNQKEFYQITWNDQYRLLMFIPEGTRKFVLLNAFIKKGKSTPESELNIARKYRRMYEEKEKERKKKEHQKK